MHMSAGQVRDGQQVKVHNLPKTTISIYVTYQGQRSVLAAGAYPAVTLSAIVK